MADENITFPGWLKDLANAIREQTGDSALMVPIDYPEIIRTKLSGVGFGGSFDGEESGSLKIDSGTFRSDAVSSRMTITHRLGKKPDYILVFYTAVNMTLLDGGNKMYMMAAWGFSSNFKSNRMGSFITTGSGYAADVGIDEYSYSSGKNGWISCPDENTFQVGQPANASGYNGFAPNSNYGWIAMSGLTGSYAPELKWVTFMNHDGTVELGKKAVAEGDDCADPIATAFLPSSTVPSWFMNVDRKSVV